MHTRSWRWFKLRVAGLLATPGTALSAYFTRDDENHPEGAPSGE